MTKKDYIIKLLEYRKENNLTQQQLSELINMSQSYISEIEQGIKSPSVKTLYDISSALKICPHVLLPVTIYCTKENKCIIGGNDKWLR